MAEIVDLCQDFGGMLGGPIMYCFSLGKRLIIILIIIFIQSPNNNIDIIKKGKNDG